MSSIWETLSSIDCSEHIEKKGQFSYLAWTWAWAMVKENYPKAMYELLDDIVYPDGTMEVRVKVDIGSNTFDRDGKPSGDWVTHTMWLPVLDFKNKAIQNPNAFDINSARMRCLVKCLAMFGLGHYIYAGESAPAPSADLTEKYEQLVSLVANKKGWELRKFTEENQAHMDNLFNMAPEGNKTRFKSDVREVYSATNAELKSNIAALEGAAGDPDSEHSVEEIKADCGELEWAFTLRGCNEVLRAQVLEQLQ